MSVALSPHERRIAEVLAKAYRREGNNLLPAMPPTPLDALLAQEESLDGEDMKARMEFVAGFVDGYLFRDQTTGLHDPHPANVMKRLFVYVRAVSPQLLLNMSGAEIAALFGQGRGAESARCNLLFEKLRAKAGYRSLTMPFQKSATAKRKYAVAQRGNRNRANSVTRAA